MRFNKLFPQASGRASKAAASTAAASTAAISDGELRKRAAEAQYNHRLRREPVGAAEINIGSERVQRV